jgi:hypothetical protein
MDALKIQRLVSQIILVQAMLVVASCNSPIGQILPGQPATRVLFIGNSYTALNGGLDQQLHGLAPASETVRIDVGGFTLEKHWNDGNALQTIRQGKWKFIVLQEQSQTPIINQRTFYENVRKFDGEIRRMGATPILLMTWERPDSVKYGVTTTNVANAYQTLGKQLVIPVAPAGTAFARSLREKPNLELYIRDGHPTVYGTYLAACVLYATIFKTSPVGNPYSDWSISAELRTYLQRIAAETTGF